MTLRMIKVKMLIFDTPPLQNHCFWVPMEAKMEPKWSLESISIAIETDVYKVMLFREGLEGPGLAGPWAQAPTHTSVDEGCPSTKHRFAQNC